MKIKVVLEMEFEQSEYGFLNGDSADEINGLVNEYHTDSKLAEFIDKMLNDVRDYGEIVDRTVTD